MMLRRFSVFFVLVLAFMPLLSPSSRAQEPDTPSANPNVTVHVVQRGENLFRIAQRYGLTVDELARFNSIGNPSNILVGQRLLIPLTPPPVFVPPTTHTVKPGENLQSIAQVYGVELQTLVSLNGIANPNALYVGQVLTIRPESESTPPTAVPELPTLSPTEAPATQTEPTEGVQVASLPVTGTGRTTHVIQRGETLFTIAQRYGVSLNDLQAANGIADASRIFAGQELVVPGVEVEQSAVELPEAITGIDITPLTLVEGKTGRIRLTTRGAANVTASFLNRSLPVIQENGGTTHTFFAPVPLETLPGIYPLVLTVGEASGQITEFAANLQISSGFYGTQYINLPADKLQLATQAVDQNEYTILRDVTSNFTPDRYFDGPMALPATAPMNARFGSRRSYNGGTFSSFHSGADFAGAAGTPVLAAAAGRVVLADVLHVRGLSVVIDHGWGVYTDYSHMSNRYVNIGEFVQSGQVIGVVGSSGRATGAHLHWELWINGIPVDPMQWVYQAFP